MADTKYFADLQALPVPDDVKIFALENDPIGTTGFKTTTLEMKDYINGGRAGGKTIQGGTGSLQNLILDSTSAGSKGTIQIADGSKLVANSATYETIITGDHDFTTKKFVLDSISDTALWDRVGTTVSLRNASDTVEFDAIGGIQFSGGQNIKTFDIDGDLTANSDERLATQKAIKTYVDNHTGNAIWELIGTEVTLTTPTNTIGATNPLTYTSHPTFTADEQIVDKRYVDDHTTNGIWDRTGTTITVKNAGDDLDFSTAGLLQGAIFDSTAKAIYNSHPTFTSDTDIVDKKYVDDTVKTLIQTEQLAISTPGQTAFTLSKPVSSNQSAFAFVNGQVYDVDYGFSVSGTDFTWLEPGGFSLNTTDRLVVIYDYDLSTVNFLQYWQRVATNLSPINAGDTLQADVTGGFQFGLSGQNVVDISIDPSLSADTDSLLVSQKAVKAYIDGHTVNGIWNRTGTTITVKNTGDDIDYSTSGLLKSMTLDSSFPSGYDSHPTFVADTQLADKKYVDDQILDQAWERVGTEVEIQNVGDNVNFSNANLVKSMRVDSSNRPFYDSHPISFGNTDLVDKIYVDDQIAQLGVQRENLEITTPGQTDFTLIQEPADAANSFVTLNGQVRTFGPDYVIVDKDFTWNNPIGGDGNPITLETSDDLQIWYGVSIASNSVLAQKNIIYVGKSGNDFQPGFSLETEVLTIGQAITLALSKTPAIDNQFRIEVVDSGTYEEDLTLPRYVNIVASGANLVGSITLNEDTSIICKNLTGTSGIVLNKNAGNGAATVTILEKFDVNTATMGFDCTAGSLTIDCHNVDCLTNPLHQGSSINGNIYFNSKGLIKGSAVPILSMRGGSTNVYFQYNSIENASINGVFLVDDTAGILYCQGNNIKSTGAGSNSVIFKVINSTAYVVANVLETTGSGSRIYAVSSNGSLAGRCNLGFEPVESTIEVGSNVSFIIDRTTNDIYKVTTSSSDAILIDEDTFQVDRYPKCIKLAAFSSYLTGNPSYTVEASGTPVIITIPFNNVRYNQDSVFDTSTHKFIAPVGGIYHFTAEIRMRNDTSQNRFRRFGAYFFDTNTGTSYILGAPFSQILESLYAIIASGSTYILLNQGDEVTIRAIFETVNSTSIVSIRENSKFQGRLVTRV